MSLMPVSKALQRVLADVAPLGTETVALDEALGRVLAENLTAERTQPPADVSAMDGYAVRAEDVTQAPVTLDIELDDKLPGCLVRATVKVTGPTGVEMEALTAVSVACLTIYDMIKAVERGVRIDGIHLVEKIGGKSGHYLA